MKFGAKLYAQDIYLGHIGSETLRGIKMIASRKCNGYNKAIDEMRFDLINGKPDGAILTRINKLAPNNTVIRGQWK